MSKMTDPRAGKGAGLCPNDKPCSACGSGHGKVRIRLRPLTREAAMNTATHVRAGEGSGIDPNGQP